MEVAGYLWVVYSEVVDGGLVVVWWATAFAIWQDVMEASEVIKLVVVRDFWGIF